jgi:hypothetical protein
MGIGTLHEGALHAGLKRWLARPGDRFEQPVDGYIIDVVRGDLLIEIQTGGCAPLARKLARLLERHRVRLVLPIARIRTIVRVDDHGDTLSRRRSPKAGHIADVFARLVSIPALIGRPGFELELLEIHESERRMFQAARARRRKGQVVVGRDLVDVVERNLVREPADLAALLPPLLPAPFTSADVERLAGIPRATAQQMLYCLHAAGAVTRVDKQGNAWCYQRRA